LPGDGNDITAELPAILSGIGYDGDKPAALFAVRDLDPHRRGSRAMIAAMRESRLK
jgi:hypothetical protein